ncbi:argonaute PAZ domain-containing protein [Thermosynechococcus sp. CL-1]|uniref:argonaute PAZ domain-containing protein n=1 Tax=Thermosynechococcus sp. CL-1 TaxID=2583530 RepID=UPI001D051958|nr:argonaute PAZ domain-containing protein [Thermosynechococcus sp. CL-1]
MMSAQFPEVEVILNRFFVKNLTQQDLRFYEYQCQFTQVPEQGSEQKALSSVCYKLGVTAVRLGSLIITRERIDTSRRQTQDWQLQEIGCRELSCQKDHERQALESFERKILECKLKEKFKKTRFEKDYEVGLIWWIFDQKGLEKSGHGWEVHRGGAINVRIEPDGKLYLEIDIHHRFYTPFTLEWWLNEYPDIQIKYVRNTYKDKNGNQQVWILKNFSNENPNDVEIKELGISLAAYHRQNGASEQDINESRVVTVEKTSDYKPKTVYHLSQRLSPVLTMEMLAQIAEQGREKSEIQGVFDCIRKNINLRLSESQKTAELIFKHIYNLSHQPELIKVNGFVMPRAKLLACDNKEIDKTAKISFFGCAKIGETKFGCLNLFDDKPQYPEKVRECLLQIAKSSDTQIQIDSCFTKSEYPKDDLDQQTFWQQWANKGIKTVLVVMPWSPNEEKQKLRNQALKAGIATQFMVPVNVNNYKSLNVCLGLLCKAKWQPVYLKPLDHSEAADLVIGFDTGTNGRLYYGTSAFAVLANGQSLGWELPDVQRGETISGQVIWQVVSSLVFKFQVKFNRYPKKILIMRDGLIQKGEFEQTIEELNKKDIAVDILSVRKSGSGRMGREIRSTDSKVTYQDAAVGTVVFFEETKSFILQSSEEASKKKYGGSARPLRVVHTHGKTPLELLALQTYHLTQLHPASGFCSSRLPWVLHLADKSSKEFQRIGSISVLQSIDREKLIAV